MFTNRIKELFFKEKGFFVKNRKNNKKEYTKPSHKAIALFFTFTFLQSLLPYNQLWANNNGPKAPEATSFEPVDATDMVNLVTGDMSYVLPLLNVPSPEGGYPLALSYHAGIAMDQEASWVGLGWNINPGAINRTPNKSPDDWYNARSYNLLASGVNAYYTGGFSISSNSGASIGMYVSYSENRAFNGETEYNTDVGVTGGYRFGSFSATGSIGTDGASLGVSSYTESVSVSQSFKDGSTTGSASIGIGGTGVSLDSRGGVGVTVLGKNTSISNRVNGLKTLNIWDKVLGASINFGAFAVNLTYTEKKVWLFEADYSINQGSLYGGDMKKVLQESIFERKVDYDSSESYNPYKMGSQLKKGNFSSISYDGYSVSGQGVTGTMKPRIFENGYLREKNIALSGNKRDGSFIGYLYPKGSNGFYKKVDNSLSDVHFYFDNEYSSYLNSSSSVWDTSTSNFPKHIFNFNTLNNTFDSTLNNEDFYNLSTGRLKKGKHVEVFTNEELVKDPSLIITPENFNRNSILVPEKGIGAFKVTTLDGKTYHYSIPVYQREKVTKRGHKDHNINENFSENQQFEPYATHWLLTGITGPDYIDSDLDGKLSEKDYGYWVLFDYGKWSDGFCWRTPREGERVFENSKSYSWGVKDVYYLDKIKTRTHTALFVKEDRKDDEGSLVNKPTTAGGLTWYTDLHLQKIDVGNNGFQYLGGVYGLHTSVVNNLILGESRYGYRFQIKKHKSLRLDKIIVVENKHAKVLKSNKEELTPKNIGDIELKERYIGWNAAIKAVDQTYDIYSRKWKGEFYSYVLDGKDIKNNTSEIEKYAHKVIDFNYDESYPLGKNSANSQAVSKGRLTLQSVKVLGKRGKGVIPSYKFTYNNPEVAFNEDKIDPWGYHESAPYAWSLNTIETPVGGKINIVYEADNYHKEIAKAERIFTEDIEFNFNEDNRGKILRIRNKTGVTNKIDFRQFFESNKTTYIDAQYWRHPEGKAHRIGDVAGYFLVKEVTKDMVVFKIPEERTSPGVRRAGNCFEEDWVFYNRVNLIYGDWFGTLDSNNCGSPRDTSNGTRSKYRFHANKDIGKGDEGGGIRVKKLIVSNDKGEKYTSQYTYSDPNTSKTSGVTMYAPSKYAKSIDFIKNLPAPSVLYKYVDVAKLSNKNELIGHKLYQFNVPQDISYYANGFNLTGYLELEQKQNTKKTNVDIVRTDDVVENVNMEFTKHILTDKTSLIGSLASVKQYNAEEQLIFATENTYGKTVDSQGDIQETVKKVKRHEASDAKTKYFLDVSSKLKEQSVLKTTKTVQNGVETTIDYITYNSVTGQPLETLSTLSDGTIFKTRSIPAFTLPEYSGELDKDNNGIADGYGMGSKADNATNKNMLSQPAINLTQIKGSRNQWKTVNSAITTWNKNWDFIDYHGKVYIPSKKDEAEKVWRKHQNFVWKGPIENDGSYAGYLGDFDNFNWSDPKNQTNNKWFNTSTVNLYNHYSKPLEHEDVNGDKMSVKMGDKHSKVIVAANAGYNEIYYSGAEYRSNIPFFFDGEVMAITDETISPELTGQTTEKSHTGKYSVKVIASTDAFRVTMRENEHRSGEYKISVWIDKENASKARVNINGNIKRFNGERLTAGNWMLLNHYENLSATKEEVISIITSQGTMYADDFRIHPSSSSMTSYVYNEWNELTYIIGANNLAVQYEYDNDGRLFKTYKEVVDNHTINGGFKETSKTKYNYKRR